MKEESKLLPKGWTWASVGELSERIHYGYTAPSVGEPIGPKMLRITDIQEGQVNWESVPYCRVNSEDRRKYLLNEGDLVFARTGATVGKSFLVRGKIPESVFASYLIRIELSRQIKKEFVYYFFQSSKYWSQIRRGQVGIGQPNVNSQKLSRITLPLAPFNEQVRIAARLEELFTRLDAGVEGLRKVKAQLKRYRQAVLKYAFEGKLTEEWRKTHKDQIEPATKLLERIKQQRKKDLKYKELATIDISELPELPEGWAWARLNDIAEVVQGQSPPSSTYNENGDGLPFYQGKLEFGNLYPTPLKWCTAPRKTADKGDVLISVRAPVGPTNVCPEKSCIGRGLAAIHGLDNIKSFYILYLMRAFENNIAGKGTGTTFKAITGDQLRGFLIPVAPLLEQDEIIRDIERRLSVAEHMERVLEQNLRTVERLRQSVLRMAFEGKLVPQDPSDEPAEKLLERIKEERAKAKGEKDIKNKPKQLELSTYVK